jgi:hypothetical protein
LWVFEDLLFKACHGCAGLTVEADFDNCLKSLSNGAQIQQSDVLLNNSIAFQESGPSETGGGRQAYLVRQILICDSPISLQHMQYLAIYRVE